MTTRRRKKHRPEEVVATLRDADAMLNAGKDLAAVLQALEVSESTLERWRAQYGGLKWLTPAAFVAGLDDTASGAVPWCVSGRGYAPPSDTPRGLFPNSLISTGTKTGDGSVSSVPGQGQQ